MFPVNPPPSNSSTTQAIPSNNAAYAQVLQKRRQTNKYWLLACIVTAGCICLFVPLPLLANLLLSFVLVGLVVTAVAVVRRNDNDAHWQFNFDPASAIDVDGVLVCRENCHVGIRWIKRHIVPRLQKQGPQPEDRIYWLTRKHPIRLVLSGFWVPLVIMIGLSVAGLYTDSRVSLPVPQIGSLKLPSAAVTTTTLATTHATNLLGQPVQPFPFSHTTVSHHVVTIPWWAWLAAWVFALGMAWVLTFGWLYTFDMITNHNLVRVHATPRLFVWMNPAAYPSPLNSIKGVTLNPGNFLDNLAGAGSVTAQLILSGNEADPYKNIDDIPRYKRFQKMLAAVSGAAVQTTP